MLNHSEMVTMVLRAGSPYLQLGHLKELARLTGVIARSSHQGQLWFVAMTTVTSLFALYLSHPFYLYSHFYQIQINMHKILIILWLKISVCWMTCTGKFSVQRLTILRFLVSLSFSKQIPG
jgi:hypothetical protein